MNIQTLLARLLPWLIAGLAPFLLLACGGGSSDGVGEGGSAAAPTPKAEAGVASLQWVTAAPLFTTTGQQHSLQARALDANGQVLDVPIQWQSSAPEVVSAEAVSTPNTTLTARATQGQAVITASAGNLSISAVAVVSPVAAGTLVLSDAQIDGEPTATAPATALRVGSTYTITLRAGVSLPTVGQRVLGQGAKAVAGEVVAVNGRVLTLALIPLQRLLPQLQLDLDLPLAAYAPRSKTAPRSDTSPKSAPNMRALASAQAQTSFSVAGFECEAEGAAGGITLAKQDVQPLGLNSLRYRVVWNNQRQLLRLSGQPGVQFELEPSAQLAFTGKVDCKLELADIPIPLPPAIGLFMGVGFPVGVGFTLEGALPVNGVALNLKGQAQASVVVGFDCNPGCTSLNNITPSGSVTPTVIAPAFTANKLDLSGQVYAWANFEGGARWSSTLQFDAIEAQAGLKFATTIATENAQAKDAASAGQYALTFEASAGPTEALGDFADLVGLILDQAKFETSLPLGRSPTAALVADKTSFKAGDDVKFQLDLTADEVLFPLQGYNVQAVRVYRKTTASDGSFVLVLANEQQASSGQTQFTLPWLATVDSGSDISFVAFVQTRLLNGLRWQVGLVGTTAPLVPGSGWGGQLTLQYEFVVNWVTHDDPNIACVRAGTCASQTSGSYVGNFAYVLSAQTAATLVPGAAVGLNLNLVKVSGSLSGQAQGTFTATEGDCTISSTEQYSLAGSPSAATLRRSWDIGLGSDGSLLLSTASSLSKPSSIDTTVETNRSGAHKRTQSSACFGGARTDTVNGGKETDTVHLIPAVFRSTADPQAAALQGSAVQTFSGTDIQCSDIHHVSPNATATCTAKLTATWDLERR